MDNINNSNSKLSYDELLEQNHELKHQIQEMQKVSKKSESILSHREAKYRALYENAPLSYQSLDVDGNFIDINPTWLLTLGYEREEVIGKNYADFLHADWKRIFEKNFPEFKRRGYVNDIHFKIKHKKGHFLDISFEGCIGTHPDGSFKQTYCVFKDISEQKRVEDALVKNQFYLSKAQEIGKIGTWELDILNNKLYWTKQNYKNFGLSHKTPLNYEVFLNCIHPDDRDYVNQEWQAAMEGKPYDIEHRVIENGKLKWLREKADVKFDENGKAISAIGLSQNITDKKNAENELKKGESIQRKLVANIGDVIVIIDKNGINRYKSPNVKRQFGWEADELVGNSAWDKVHPDHVEGAKKLLADLVRNPEKTITTELLYLRKDGEYRWIEITISNLLYDPEIKGFLGNYHDVSERRNLQEEQAKHEQLLNETGRLAKIGGWELDIETMTSYYTQETKRIYGIPLDSDAPKGIEGIKYYPEEAQRKLQKLVHDAIEKGKPYDVELPFINKQGKHLWVRTIGIPEKYSGKVSRLFGTIQDISERKRAEESLRRSQEMLLTSQSVANICSYSTNLIVNEIDKSHWECSPEFYKIFGIDETYPHTIEGWIGFLHPEYREELVAYHESVVSEKKSFNREYKIIRINDGAERWVHGTGELVYDKKGTPIRMHGAIQDITERKQAELALKESELYLEKAQGVSKTGHFIWDLEKSILTWSNEMFNIYGLKQENGTPSPEEYLNFVHEDDKYLLSSENLEMIIQTPNHELQYRIIDQSTNDVKYVYLWGETNFDKEGKPATIIGVIQDITKQKNTEFELIKAKERAEANEQKLLQSDRVFNLTLDMFCIAGYDGYYKYLNPAWERTLGWSTEELLSKPWLDFVHPDDVGKTENVKSVIVDGKEIYKFENRYICKDGSTKWLSWNSQPFPKENIMIGAVRDITETKRIEIELLQAKEKAEQREKQNKQLIETASDAIYLTNSKGIIIEVNKEACKILQKQRHELIGQSILTVDPNFTLEEFIEFWTDIPDGEPMVFETTHITKKGDLIPVEISGNKFSVQNETFYLGIARDITERKISERKIKLNEARLEALVELGEMTSKTNDEIHNFTLNKAIELTQSQIGFLGFVNDDESEVDIYKWSDSAMKECVVEDYMMNFVIAESGIWGDVIRDRKPLVIDDYDAPIKNKKGIPKGHVSIKNYLSIPTFSDGKIVAILSVANKNESYNQTDIHQTTLLLDGMRKFLEQRKEKEELIKSKLKAEEADRLKSAFLANMSHEIRTPMNGILGFTELLQDDNLSVENQRNYVDIIRKSGNRLLNTVNDLIEISKIESGDISVTKSEVDIIGHLNTQVAFFKPEAEKKSLKIVVQNNIDGHNLLIHTDKNKLSSILSNLIKNAIKYTDEGTIKVGLKIENNQILFTCQDTGVGIPKSRHEAIFNRFEQADIDDKLAKEGSGLGLAIVKSYVEMLDGNVWVESELGKGSTFYVLLPYKHENQKERNIPQEENSSDSDIKNIKVLVVEDDEISSMHLLALLKGKVKNIITTRNGTEAIDACKNDSDIDLILMDIKMPVTGGLEATKKIREFNKDIVIIAQTAYALEGDKEKAIDAGCNDYISKPINKNKLFKLVNKYF